MRLLDLLFPPRPDEAVIRDLSTDAFLTLIAPRVVAKSTPETSALLLFSDPRVRAAVHEAKYHGSKHAFELLGAALAEYLRDANERFYKPLLLPIPLGASRRKDRGFNQKEEIIARAVASIGESVFAVELALLERTRETVSQVSLSRDERKKNMRGAFRATYALHPAHTYIVVDDVITTGATLRAAIEALREAGATHIVPIALAH